MLEVIVQLDNVRTVQFFEDLYLTFEVANQLLVAFEPIKVHNLYCEALTLLLGFVDFAELSTTQSADDVVATNACVFVFPHFYIISSV